MVGVQYDAPFLDVDRPQDTRWVSECMETGATESVGCILLDLFNTSRSLEKDKEKALLYYYMTEL